MKFYSLDTEFTFGKFKGKTVREVLDLHPFYLEWCLLKLDHFYISDEALESIKQIKQDFSFSEKANQKRQEKFETWQQEQENRHADNYEDDYHHHWSDDELEMGDWDYNPMNPAHDPDENPWIDVFGPGDEAETAYWNTD
jgi:hypothetical protein